MYSRSRCLHYEEISVCSDKADQCGDSSSSCLLKIAREFLQDCRADHERVEFRFRDVHRARFIRSALLSSFRNERDVEFWALNGADAEYRNPRKRTGRKGCWDGKEGGWEGQENAAFQYWRQPATLPQRRDVSRLVSGTLIPPAGS